jgi:hypothetical protein
MSNRLSGKVCIITGTGGGIGREAGNPRSVEELAMSSSAPKSNGKSACRT